MRDLYTKVQNNLSKIEFDKIYPGFHRFQFALYNEETVWLEDREIPRTDEFYGNTTIKFEGQQIAIWKVEFNVDECDVEWFVADIVHEMFHAYQWEKDWIKNVPSDLLLLQYPDNLTNYTVKRQENLMLADAIVAPTEEQRRIYDTVKASRELRKHLIGDFVDIEETYEQFEGRAELSGCLALKQLNEEKFMKRMQGVADRLREENSSFFDIRRTTYFTGTVTLYLETLFYRDETRIEKTFPGDETTSEKMTSGDKAGNEKQPLKNKSTLEKLFEQMVDEKKEKIQSIINGNHTRTEVETYICGYDPMNQFRIDDYIYARNMIVLWVDGKPQKINGPVVLKMQENSSNMVKAYWN